MSTDWVLAVERAYVRAVTAPARDITAPPGDARDDHDDLLEPRDALLAPYSNIASAAAAAGAVASRYLAVGTPRTLGLIADTDGQCAAAIASLAAHRTWFQPRDVRCAGRAADTLAAATGGHAVAIADALAADIVCVHAPGTPLVAAQLRRGTHINVLVPCPRDADLVRLAMIAYEVADAAQPGAITLGQLAAGLVDGRQLDELTLFILADAAIALAALIDA